MAGIRVIGGPDTTEAIYPVSFYRVKSRTIRAICEQLMSRFGGEVPAKLEELLELPGVGRKTANIVVRFYCRRIGVTTAR